VSITKNSSRLILIGMMGSGKTTVGRILAQRMGYLYLDTDKIIMENEEKTIPQIFEKYGEAYFRVKEQELINNIQQERVVISTGGGLPCFFNNIEIVNHLGTSFFLKASIKVLVERLKNQNASNRPLIVIKEETETIKRLKELYQQRKIYYEKAHYTINVNQNIDKVVGLILKQVELINKI